MIRLLFERIQRERQGEAIDQSLVKSLIRMFSELESKEHNIYNEFFEKPFLETTTQFYRYESLQFIHRNTCSDYMKKVEVRIKEEMDRAQKYLNPQTEAKIKEILDSELIAQHMDTLVKVVSFSFTFTFSHFLLIQFDSLQD
jgi:cullin 3